MVATSKSYEHFYVKDLEAKLDAMRGREFSLTEEMERASMLVRGLQQENAVLADKEREMLMVMESQQQHLAALQEQNRHLGVKAEGEKRCVVYQYEGSTIFTFRSTVRY